jgi:transposase-like protein
MFDAGKAVAEIALCLKVSPSTVYRWLRERGTSATANKGAFRDPLPSVSITQRPGLTRVTIDIPETGVVRGLS